jgi:hypothetical protein
MRWLLAAAMLPLLAGCEEAPEEVFRLDFEVHEIGKDVMQLGLLAVGEADLRVAADGTNKVLTLAPNPLDTYGFLFGPSEAEDVCAQGRFFATAAGRRCPVFGIGLSGVGGYVLRVSPAYKRLELLKGDEVKQTAPYEWADKSWTALAIAVRKTKDGKWNVLGKAWTAGKDEPKEWMVSFEETEKPVAGRAAAWGLPYAETPISFDDLIFKRWKRGP